MLVEEEEVLNVHQTALECPLARKVIHDYGLERPTACATIEKKPFRILAAMYDSKLVAAAHQADVPRAMDVNETSTGRRPK